MCSILNGFRDGSVKCTHSVLTQIQVTNVSEFSSQSFLFFSGKHITHFRVCAKRYLRNFSDLPNFSSSHEGASREIYFSYHHMQSFLSVWKREISRDMQVYKQILRFGGHTILHFFCNDGSPYNASVSPQMIHWSVTLDTVQLKLCEFYFFSKRLTFYG